MRIALYQPDIAQNTGTILRLAACFATSVDIIGPTGFDMTDKAMRRAGMDYLTHADFIRHDSFQSFQRDRVNALLERDDANGGITGGPSSMHRRVSQRLILLTSHADVSIYDFSFQASDVLLLGRESAGVPEAVHAVADARIKIPIAAGLRSLNLAVAAGIALAEGLRQTRGFPT